MLVVVDSSVWIDVFAGRENEETARLRVLLLSPQHRLCVLDLILPEILQGARNEADAARLDGYFSGLPLFAAGGGAAVRAASARYRELRGAGITVRKTMDVLIASWCLDHDAGLLHRDRDFEPFQDVFGLRIA